MRWRPAAMELAGGQADPTGDDRAASSNAAVNGAGARPTPRATANVLDEPRCNRPGRADEPVLLPVSGGWRVGMGCDPTTCHHTAPSSLPPPPLFLDVWLTPSPPTSPTCLLTTAHPTPHPQRFLFTPPSSYPTPLVTTITWLCGSALYFLATTGPG